ncbi:MAG: SurA N-terminal domain-containing protein [Hyphomicrobium sp.]
MLDALRRGAQGWLAKFLFAILIISFGVFFGIEDVFRGYGRGSIAKVGETDITQSDFDRAMQNELAGLSRQAGKRVSMEDARAIGIDRLVLQRLTFDTALQTQAKSLGLAVSDDVLLDGLKRDENLHGADGKFSREILNEIMQQMGVNERGLFAILRKDEINRQVINALTSAIAVPQPLVDVQHAWSSETRRIEHFKIDAAKAVKVPEPDDAALKGTFEKLSSRFVVPEYRKLAVLLLTAAELKKEMSVSDDEVKETYDRTKDTYDLPEKRRVQQIAFKDKAAAEEARKAIEKGKSFRDAAKEAGATEADINLGMVTKKQLIDKTVAEAAFALKRDAVSEVIEGRFRPVLIRVVEIEAGKESTLAEVKDKIRDKLSEDKAAQEVQQRFELVEEQRNLGKSLKEIADALKLRFIEVEAADRSNKRPDGGRALDHPDERTLVEAGFGGETGVQREAVELKQSNGYGWVDVLSVTASKQKSFEDAKADVKTAYEETERKRLVDELAAQLVKRSDEGAEFDKLAAEVGGKVELTEAINRSTAPPGLDEDAVQKAFAIAKGKAGSANTADRTSRVVFRVVEITPAPAVTEQERAKLAAELKADMAEDQVNAYVGGLTRTLGVTINQAELDRATGVPASQ